MFTWNYQELDEKHSEISSSALPRNRVLFSVRSTAARNEFLLLLDPQYSRNKRAFSFRFDLPWRVRGLCARWIHRRKTCGFYFGCVHRGARRVTDFLFRFWIDPPRRVTRSCFCLNFSCPLIYTSRECAKLVLPFDSGMRLNNTTRSTSLTSKLYRPRRRPTGLW